MFLAILRIAASQLAIDSISHPDPETTSLTSRSADHDRPKLAIETRENVADRLVVGKSALHVHRCNLVLADGSRLYTLTVLSELLIKRVHQTHKNVAKRVDVDQNQSWIKNAILFLVTCFFFMAETRARHNSNQSCTRRVHRRQTSFFLYNDTNESPRSCAGHKTLLLFSSIYH